MNRQIPLSLLLLLSACGKKTAVTEIPAPKEALDMVEFIDYTPPSGTFSCRAPARWKGEETAEYGPDEVSFISAAPGYPPGSVDISISRYPNKSDKYVDAEVYAKSRQETSGKPAVYDKKIVEGRTVLRFARERPARVLHSKKTLYTIREDVALIVVPGGFFEITHAAPLDAHQYTLPVFEEVVRSFKPKS